MLQAISSKSVLPAKPLVRAISATTDVQPPPYKEEEDPAATVPPAALIKVEPAFEVTNVSDNKSINALQKSSEVLQARAGLRVRSWNQPINASYQVDMSSQSCGSDVLLRSRNHAINSTLYLEGHSGEADIRVRTKNAPINLAVVAGNVSPQIECRTKNAPVSLQLDQGFHGILELRTKQAEISLSPLLAQRAVRMRNRSCCKEKKWSTYQVGRPGGRDSAWIKTKHGRIDVGLLV